MPKVLRIINRFNIGGPTFNAAYLSKYLPSNYETLLIGGEKEDLLIFLSNIIWNYQFKNIYIEDDTKYYDDDTDFNLCQSTLE